VENPIGIGESTAHDVHDAHDDELQRYSKSGVAHFSGMRDRAMGGNMGSARPSKSDADPRSRPPYICDPCENAYTEAERQRATAQATSPIRQAPTAMIERRPSIVVVPFLRSPIEDACEFRRALTSTVQWQGRPRCARDVPRPAYPLLVEAIGEG
jgi:hypothetical protein